MVRRSRHRCEPRANGDAAIVVKLERPSISTVVDMHSSVGHHVDYVDVSPARLGGAKGGFHCSFHVGRVIDRYEYELPFQHDSSEILLSPLPSGGTLRFDLTRAMGRARDHQQRP